MFQCHTPEDAARVVEMLNSAAENAAAVIRKELLDTLRHYRQTTIAELYQEWQERKDRGEDTEK